MKCRQCQKDRPDDQVAPLSRTWAIIMVIGHMLMGTYQWAKRKPGIFPRNAGDLVCRECRLVSAIVVVFAFGMMALIGAVILWAK